MVSNVFFFSHNVFKRLLSQARKNQGLLGKWLIKVHKLFNNRKYAWLQLLFAHKNVKLKKRHNCVKNILMDICQNQMGYQLKLD